jgi:hypothetical protein
MSVEVSESGSIIVTGEHIQIYRLLALRSALKMEAMGLRMSRGFSALKSVKSITGLTGTRATMPAKYEAWLKANNIIS